MIYGYARVSTLGQAKDGNSLNDQIQKLIAAGASEIIEEHYTGTTTNRPEFSKLIDKLQDGDTLVVTKLDRFARSAGQGVQLIQELIGRGVSVNVLNMGLMDNKPASKLMITMMLAFAEFERDMIVERTQEGKRVAKQQPGYREGRPKIPKAQIELALSLLEPPNNKSYNEVVRMTGISKSTLQRRMREKKAKEIEENVQ
ncbi:MAG: recombinase family protein [Anaerovibrio sp.]|uniref:recombinase family protein n=1 Tax=Anaerovibrio sp. TaxID=1872532 RepID=UPI001AFE6ECC|nr:recombinase family protein [Anaerovibrio sp.]MBO6245101.1 recombinase family protein [Anaerovibrio sp.]